LNIVGKNGSDARFIFLVVRQHQKNSGSKVPGIDPMYESLRHRLPCSSYLRVDSQSHGPIKLFSILSSFSSSLISNL